MQSQVRWLEYLVQAIVGPTDIIKDQVKHDASNWLSKGSIINYETWIETGALTLDQSWPKESASLHPVNSPHSPSALEADSLHIQPIATSGTGGADPNWCRRKGRWLPDLSCIPEQVNSPGPESSPPLHQEWGGGEFLWSRNEPQNGTSILCF